MVFLYRQNALDPVTGALVDGDIAAQTERVMKNLEAVLREAGAGFGDVVRCGIFLVDLADFARVDEVYARAFPAAPPGPATVQVSALPRGARVEIDAIAVIER
jgi:2-iminobutanoate/2-iminopropanoate deaminase